MDASVKKQVNDRRSPAKRMLTSKMGDPIPFVVYWLLVTCWTVASAVTIRSTRTDEALRQQRHIRRIDSSSDPEDWKPIDYGHPMRDDPTLVYVPPVVDPVHYGIHSAEPLWPVQKSKMPPFRLPPEAMLAAASIDHRWRPRSTHKLKDTVLAVPKTSQQRLDHGSLSTMHHGHHGRREPEFYRYPVEATAWNGYDGSMSRLIGRSPALSSSRPALSRFQSQTRIREYTLPEILTSNRFFGETSSGRSFGSGNTIDYGKSASGARITNEMGDNINLEASRIASIDRADKQSDDASLSMEFPNRNQTLNDNKTTTRVHRKRERGPFSPLQFIIQQGHSKVRKYGV